MPEVTLVAFFTSSERTCLYIETPSGVKRDCFAYNSKRKGRNIIIQCEPPVPWTKTVHPHRINTELTDFLKGQYWTVTTRGDTY